MSQTSKCKRILIHINKFIYGLEKEKEDQNKHTINSSHNNSFNILYYHFYLHYFLKKYVNKIKFIYIIRRIIKINIKI